MDEERQLGKTPGQPTKTNLDMVEDSHSAPEDNDRTKRGARVVGGTNAPPTVPPEFMKWKDLFEEETGLEALPKHQPWDHTITIMKGKTIPFGPLYALS